MYIIKHMQYQRFLRGEEKLTLNRILPGSPSSLETAGRKLPSFDFQHRGGSSYAAMLFVWGIQNVTVHSKAATGSFIHNSLIAD